jgi:hypothetical protein
VPEALGAELEQEEGPAYLFSATASLGKAASVV